QNGRIAVTNPLIEPKPGSGESYKMDLEGLRKVIEREKPKMLILCNPHNPIGIAWKPEVLRELAEICAEHDVIVVSDEIHGAIVWGDHRHTPFASVSDKAANISITFGAPSKTFNIPGFVSSWCVVKNPEMRRHFFDWLESKELNGVNITSVVATEAAYNKGEEWLAQAKEYLADNIRFVSEYLRDNVPGINMVQPEATFLVWLDCRALGLSHKALLDLFINKARLALNDGAMFGNEGFGFMRMNVASPRSVLRQALMQLRDALNDIQR
ncbi:MAG: aminotransferase class I/II-fold pyridoxal phosphate-dependent enzyme, partial [Muribaculaceae bacterium]|nr:aminotransferase class I/II-fold pyridoxal phosphate-dependent enzyme [Muribaculaceae bacterium]